MASTPPLIFKRTKAKPAQRARQTSPDNDTESGPQTTEDDSPSILITKLKNKVKRAKPKSRLSFGGDEDEVCVLNAHEDISLIWGRVGEWWKRVSG